MGVINLYMGNKTRLFIRYKNKNKRDGKNGK